jgi:hypothetical protein
MMGINILTIPTDAEPVIWAVKPSLANFQAMVGGNIEAVNLPGCTMYINEDGKNDGMPFNKNATLLAMGVLADTDFIAGPAFLTGPVDSEGCDTPITPEILATALAAMGIEKVRNG